ncbi:MAG: oxidoreductase [Pseudomonadota bacterium]|jgi:NAD(P)-dependent dehydrogenase (short-subunit alcohol dehydrogenase family)|nr:oxidoreductase [Pseudomonadota bacterium]
MSTDAKTWFITGVSRGFGKVLAEQLLADGATVIGTTRDGTAQITPGRGSLTVLPLEITDPQAVRDTVARAFALGRVDVIVNNAGYGLLSTVEEASEADIEHLFAVNFHGPRRIIQAALTHLRAQRSGHIVNITSIAGIAPAAGSGYYAAAKMAVEGLSQSLAREVAPLGIRVTLVEPGAFRTDFLSAHSIRQRNPALGDYAPSAGAVHERLAAMAGRQPGDPARAAAAIIAAVRAEQPPLHLVLGPDAYQRTREVLEAFSAELDSWKTVSLGTDFPAGP